MTRAAVALLVLFAAACTTPDQPELAFGQMDRPAATPDPKQIKAKPPPMDPTRKVVAQSCNQPVPQDQSNLRCI